MLFSVGGGRSGSQYYTTLFMFIVKEYLHTNIPFSFSLCLCIYTTFYKLIKILL